MVAGFQVSISGRFWVSTEAYGPEDVRFLSLAAAQIALAMDDTQPAVLGG
jgi:hypothetical protein